MRTSPLSMSFRMGYVILLLLPTVIHNYLFFPCFILFYSVAALSLGFTFMPTEMSYYVFLSSIIAIAGYFYTHKPSYPAYPLLLFLVLLVHITSVNIINSSSIEKVTYSLLCFVLILGTINKKNIQKVLSFVPYAFIIVTLTCSILLLINKEFFLIQSEEGYDRLMTASINYSCSTIGIGTVLAFIYALNPTNRLITRILCIAAFAISIVALLMEASRGALLSVGVACSVFILFSKMKTSYKVLGVLFIIVFANILYQSNSLDLLIYRFQIDDGTASHRTEIWALKLNAFRESGRLIEYFGGIGLDRAIHLGKNVFLHNDFLAFYIEYGFWGLSLFLLFLVYPLIIASKSVRPYLFPFIAFIFTTCSLLEPFAIGYMPLFFLLLYVYLLAFNKDSIVQ